MKLWNIWQELWNRRFVRDVFTLQAGGIVIMGLGLLKSVLFARYLGLADFGLYSIILVMTGTLSLLTNIGQNQASLTFFAEAYGKKNASGMASVMKYYLLISLVSAGIFIGLASASPWLASTLYSDPFIGEIARIAFLAFMFSVFDSLFINMLQITGHIRLMTILENIGIFLQLVLSVLFLVLGFGVLGIFIGLLLSNMCMAIAYLGSYMHIRKTHALPHFRETIKNKESIRSYLSQGIWIALDKNVGNLFPQGFLFIISLSASKETVGIAKLAIQMGLLPKSVILPHIGRMAASTLPKVLAEGKATLRSTCARLIKHSLFAHAFLSFGSLIALPILVLFFYGIEYSAVIPPMLWIILIQIVASINIANSPLLRIFRKAHISAIWGTVKILSALGVLYMLSAIIEPLNALIVSILIMYGLGLGINGYLYLLLREKSSLRV